jgi:hypothetical protein
MRITYSHLLKRSALRFRSRNVQVGLSSSYTETDGTRNQSYISIVRTVNNGLDRIME